MDFNIKGIQNLPIFSFFCSGQVGTKLVEEMGILDFFKTLTWKITELWNFFDRVGILKFSWIFNVGFHGSLENQNFEIFLVAFSQILYLKMTRSFSRLFKFRFFGFFCIFVGENRRISRVFMLSSKLRRNRSHVC